VRHLRTGLSWADWFRPNAQSWFDSQMLALEEFSTTLTLCFTPEHMGVAPHYTSPPQNPEDFVDFAVWATTRYASPGYKNESREIDPGERLAVAHQCSGSLQPQG
jgi:beta-xylosidase